jgi:Ca2+-binding EF-hand superfamily protein
MKRMTFAMALALLVATAPAAFAVKQKTAARTGWSASQRAQLDQQFAQFDRNGDGLITRDEFPADAALFNNLDLNRDGRLTRREIEQAVPNQAALESQVRTYDRNGDGIITRDEYPGDAATFDRLDRNHDGVLSDADRQGRGRGRNNAQMRFRGMDRNGDGVITRDEWRGNDNSFQQHDRNGDGVLSGSELRGGGNGNGR